MSIEHVALVQSSILPQVKKVLRIHSDLLRCLENSPDTTASNGEAPVFEFGECGVSSHYHYHQVQSDRVVVPVRVPSTGEIKLFNLLLGIITVSYLKPFGCVQIVHIT